MQKAPIPQSHKFSRVHNVNKSQTKLETTKAPKTVKVWLFPVVQCVPRAVKGSELPTYFCSTSCDPVVCEPLVPTSEGRER